MGVLEILLYAASFSGIGLYFLLSLRRSELGMVFLGYDIFFFLGCCVYPIVLETRLITPGENGISAMAAMGKPGLLTAMHVFAVAMGMFLGYVLGSRLPRARVRDASSFGDAADFLVPDPAKAWRVAVLAGLVTIGLYIWAVGLEVALVNANLGRAGVFEGYGEDARWLFLKTVAAVLGTCFVFLPGVLLSKTDRGFLVLYVASVVALFVVSPSRSFFLTSLLIPVMVYLHASGTLLRPRVLALISVICVAAGAVLLYGKYFFEVPVALLSGDRIGEIEAYQSDRGAWGFLEALLRNMEFQWYSVDAGLRHFSSNGPLLPTDVLLAPFGFVPVRALDWVGLGSLSYVNVGMESQLACINANMFLTEGCSIPPHYAGYSAYLAPVAGGLVMGFTKNWLFGRLEAHWVRIRKHGFDKLWLPYLGVHLVALIFSLVSQNIAIASFVMALLAAYAAFKTLNRALFRRLRAAY